MPETIGHQPLRIVVANDDPSYLDMMREVLLDYGYHVTTCLTANEAYDRICELLPDLVIVDLLFPGSQQGMELISKLRLSTATQRTPLIVCSAAVSVLHDVTQQFAVNGVYTLDKPFTHEALLSCISQAAAYINQQQRERAGIQPTPETPSDG